MIKIDLKQGTLTVEDGRQESHYELGTPEAFALITDIWLRSGWDNKYVYSFSWLGRPIIQLPEDMIRVQEVIYGVRPDVIIETGVAHGGSLIYYASLCKVMERGRVIGVDIEIRPHNRRAIETHEMSHLVTLIEGSSTSPDVVQKVHSLVKSGEVVLVMLDSNHSKQHVADELEAYCDLVTTDSYIVAADGIMEQVVGAPRTQPDWTWNNPKQAALEFVATNKDFIIEEPPFPFNEGNISERVSYWPSAFIKRVR